MKQFLIYIAIINFGILMSSCISSGMEQTSEVIVEPNGVVVEEVQEVPPVDNNVVVVYINGIANYRYWDYRFNRYYYRPVPYRHYNHYYHHKPIHRPMPGHPAPHHPMNPARPYRNVPRQSIGGGHSNPRRGSAHQMGRGR